MVIDASALLVIATGEADARALEVDSGAAERRLSSPIAPWQAARAVARQRE